MKKKLISFDLQGTLSSSAFSDEFWLELLPTLYAQKHGMSVLEAKERLEADFQQTGKYHELFYNHRIRLNSILGQWEFQDIVRMLKTPAEIFPDMIKLLQIIPVEIPVVIISATTRDFIDHELGEHKSKFFKTYSSIDDFATPGKPAPIFERVAALMETNPEDCLHIGDCREMDFNNSQAAGWKSYHLDKKRPLQLSIGEIQKVLADFIAG